MSEYVWILLWIGAVAVARSMKEFRRTEIVCGQPVRRYTWWFAIVIFIPIIWIVGHRTWIGDTYLYLFLYRLMPRSITAIPWYLQQIEEDKGFTVLSIIIKLFAGDNTVIYLMTLALIQGLSLVAIFRKYSVGYVFSVFLFLASTDYISWMMNGLRQFTAVTIIFATTKWILEKRYKYLIPVLLLASTIHQSALIMIPIVFIVRGKAWNRKTLAVIAAALLAIFFVGEFTSLLGSAMENTQYGKALSDVSTGGDDGTNPIRVFF